MIGGLSCPALHLSRRDPLARGDLDRLRHGGDGRAVGHGDAVSREELLSLVLEEIHGAECWSIRKLHTNRRTANAGGTTVGRARLAFQRGQLLRHRGRGVAEGRSGGRDGTTRGELLQQAEPMQVKHKVSLTSTTAIEACANA